MINDHKYVGYTFGRYQQIRNYFRNYKRAPWMLFKAYCEIAAKNIFGMNDTLELNWEDPRLYIDGKGWDLYHKKKTCSKDFNWSQQKSTTIVRTLTWRYSEVKMIMKYIQIVLLWQGLLDKTTPLTEATTGSPMTWWNDSLQQLKATKEFFT